MSELETASSFLTYMELEQEYNTGSLAPALRTKNLTLDTAHIAPAIFQPRLLDDSYSKYASDRHIEGLMNSSMSAPYKNLDPLVVWWSGVRWIVIDGQHRYVAYKKLYKLKKRNGTFPVIEFAGTLEEARRHSSYLNRKNKLPMTESDKTNMAWKFVLTSKSSIKQIREATGAGKGTIDRQRAMLRKIKGMYPETWEAEIGDSTWRQVLNFEMNKDEYTEDDDDRIRQQVKEIGLKHIPSHLIQQCPHLVFDGLLGAFSSLKTAGIEYFSGMEAYGDTYEIHQSEIDDDSDFWINRGELKSHSTELQGTP